MLEFAAEYSRSLKAEDDTSGDGRDDLSAIRGFGKEVAVSVCRRESRRDFRMDGSAEVVEAKSTTEVVWLSDGLLSGLRDDLDRRRL
jgi:hypothetical protein